MKNRYLQSLCVLFVCCVSAIPTRADDPPKDEPFKASFYLGEAIDTFAADETLKYLNEDASGKQKMRAIGGFDFAYRLTPVGKNWQLTVLGETVHGARSQDVDCTKNPDLSVCTENGYDPDNPQKGIVYMLRNASSLEAFTGLRFDFKRLNKDSENPAWLYVKGQAGFLTVEGNGDDVIDMHHVAIGAVAEGGALSGSFLEVGFGRTDLFLRKKDSRFKIDGLLSFPAPSFFPDVIKDNIRMFVELTADTDLGGGSDSVQSYFGLDFSIWPRK